MASTAVFNTTELLEQIYSLLPMKDLLHAQLVSRRSKTVIERSQVLQKLLFLAPEEPKSRWRLVKANPSRNIQRSLTEVSLDPNTRHTGRRNSFSYPEITALRLNELLVKVYYKDYDSHAFYIESRLPAIAFKTPLTDIKEHHSYGSGDNTPEFDDDLSNETGITLADFLRYAEYSLVEWGYEESDFKGWINCALHPRGGYPQASIELLKERIAEEKKSKITAEASPDQE